MKLLGPLRPLLPVLAIAFGAATTLYSIIWMVHVHHPVDLSAFERWTATHEIDLRMSKLFRFGRTRAALNFDLYNLPNASTVRARLGTYGTTWQRPTSLLDARLYKISAQFDF